MKEMIHKIRCLAEEEAEAEREAMTEMSNPCYTYGY
jgi:hypothetical protein